MVLWTHKRVFEVLKLTQLNNNTNRYKIQRHNKDILDQYFKVISKIVGIYVFQGFQNL